MLGFAFAVLVGLGEGCPEVDLYRWHSAHLPARAERWNHQSTGRLGLLCVAAAPGPGKVVLSAAQAQTHVVADMATGWWPATRRHQSLL